MFSFLRHAGMLGVFYFPPFFFTNAFALVLLRFRSRCAGRPSEPACMLLRFRLFKNKLTRWIAVIPCQCMSLRPMSGGRSYPSLRVTVQVYATSKLWGYLGGGSPLSLPKGIS